MNEIKVAINGFGRIGRNCLKSILKNDKIVPVAINDLAPTSTLSHLFKYDSIHGKFEGEVIASESRLIINGHDIHVFNEKDPEALPWEELSIDYVIESTGVFLTREGASKHLKAGANNVITTAPLKDNSAPTVVMGVNDDTVSKDDKIISNASCTTNCLAPMVKILQDNIGIVDGFINTIHAYTADQNLHDAPHKDLRRSRAAAYSIIPTTTGAARAVGQVIPDLDGKLDGIAMRVPVVNGSVVDFTVNLKKECSIEEINQLVKKHAESEMKGILEYTEEPIVSADIIGNTHSCIFDSQLTNVIGKSAKVVGWYDNEIGYSHRVIDLLSQLK